MEKIIMKCIANEKGFYDGTIVKPNEIFNAKECPSWAKPLKENAKSENKKAEGAPVKEEEQVNTVIYTQNPIEGGTPAPVKEDEVKDENTEHQPSLGEDDLDTKTPKELENIPWSFRG